MKKTWGATLTTLQDMTVLDDCDVSQSFTHSPSSESVKSSVSDGYLNKPSLAKRRANQQETELFYFNVRNGEAGRMQIQILVVDLCTSAPLPDVSTDCFFLHCYSSEI